MEAVWAQVGLVDGGFFLLREPLSLPLRLFSSLEKNFIIFIGDISQLPVSLSGVWEGGSVYHSLLCRLSLLFQSR